MKPVLTLPKAQKVAAKAVSTLRERANKSLYPPKPKVEEPKK